MEVKEIGPMEFVDYGRHLILSIFLIIGGYQFYFWCQRNAMRAPRRLHIGIDHRIPYMPSWVWVYSFLYYPAILYVNLIIETPQQFTQTALSYLVLLFLQMAFFLTFPVETPPDWRAFNRRRGPSERFLAFVQSFDGRSNCFPSMHCSVAAMTALYLEPHFGAIVFGFPLLIGLSCLFTKQHYLADIPAGLALGWVTFGMFQP
jgi:membrane-associated phospholipid phosphatase